MQRILFKKNQNIFQRNKEEEEKVKRKSNSFVKILNNFFGNIFLNKINFKKKKKNIERFLKKMNIWMYKFEVKLRIRTFNLIINEFISIYFYK